MIFWKVQLIFIKIKLNLLTRDSKPGIPDYTSDALTIVLPSLLQILLWMVSVRDV